VLYATITSIVFAYACRFRLPSRMKNGTELKLKIVSQGVRLRSGIDKERAASLPRFVEKSTSRLELTGKGWFSTSFGEQETSPFQSKHLRVRENRASSLVYLSNFSSALPQQLAISV
jgi:hypothetical protein